MNITSKHIDYTTTMSLTIASFDIGIKNFAFCVEVIPLEQVKLYHQLSHDEIFKTGEIISLTHIDLSDKGRFKVLNSDLFNHLTDVLFKYSSLWDKCDVFLIEKQMSIKHKTNIKALRIFQHCFSFMTFRYGTSKTIIEYPSRFKTHTLGGGDCKTGYARKRWCEHKALHICSLKSDNKWYAVLQSFSDKMDDLADTICQLNSLKVELFNYF